MVDSNDALKFSERVMDVLKKIPLPLVFSILSIFLLMVYWFIAIFIFHRAFYDSNPIWITLIFCFAFSFTWFIISFGLSIFSITFMDKEVNFKTENNGVLLISGFVSIAYLCCCILSVYLVRKYYYPLLKFELLLLVSYSYMILLLLRAVLFLIVDTCRDKKTDNQIQ